MKHEWYKPTKDYTIAGIPALRHRKTKELCLFGKKGQVWKYDSKLIGVLIYGSSKKAIREINKFAVNPLSDLACKSEEEIGFLVDKKYIHDIMKLLSISKQLGRQYANMEAFIETL